MDDQAPSEQTLIDQTRSGRTEAFGELVRRHHDRLYRSLVVLTGRREDAEDVVQEAFVLAFQKLELFQGRSQFYTWIYRIAMNCWMGQRRRLSARVSVQSLQSVPGDQPDTEDLPSDRAERVEEIGRLRAALSALPDDARTILVLRELDGANYETIAQTLDIPLGTVRSRLHRARVLLRDQLQSSSS